VFVWFQSGARRCPDAPLVAAMNSMVPGEIQRPSMASTIEDPPFDGCKPG
jgi:hypothetical protein